jgi:glycosyltransferase involved in cell wall biosynthesis
MTSIATLMAVYKGDDPSALAIALDSVLDQKFTDDVIESHLYLVVDGPVSDEINRVIEDYKDRIFLVHRLSDNLGLAVALNALIQKLGDEEYVFRMDADDRSCAVRYQSQLNHFRRYPDTDILGTDIIEVDTEKGVRRRVNFCRGHREALSRLCRGVPVAHPTVCFKRHVIDHVGGYPLTGTNEDIALWFKCAKAGFKFDNVRQPLLEFTVSSNFWRRRSIGKALSELRCYATGIWAMDGITWKYVFPLLRFLLRVAPRWVSRKVYGSPLRRIAKI